MEGKHPKQSETCKQELRAELVRGLVWLQVLTPGYAFVSLENGW